MNECIRLGWLIDSAKLRVSWLGLLIMVGGRDRHGPFDTDNDGINGTNNKWGSNRGRWIGWILAFSLASSDWGRLGPTGSDWVRALYLICGSYLLSLIIVHF